MNLITDRTKTDVLLRTEKGIYGAVDLDRVESAVAQLVVLAKGIGIDVDLVVKADWALSSASSEHSWPTDYEVLRYLSNVHNLCAAVEVAVDLPENMWGLTYLEANQIEQALLAVYERIKKTLRILQYSGDFYAGEESVL